MSRGDWDSDKERIFYFDGSERSGSVFTGFSEAPAIYVAARIMNITALPEVKMFGAGSVFAQAERGRICNKD